MTPKSACSGRWRRERANRPAMRRSVAMATSRRSVEAERDRLLERDRHVRAERRLHLHRTLGREPVARAVVVALERDPLVVDRV